MRKEKNKKIIKALAILFFLLLTFFFCYLSVYYMNYNKEAYEHQSEEEELADKFIEDMMEQACKEDEEPINTETRPSSSDENNPEENAEIQNKPETEKNIIETKDDRIEREVINDENYYERNGIIYTPDYAVGYLQCVLEYPACGIRRGVYSGSWSDINFDLDIWMATAARPDYELGKTHYCIYGHNHTSQDLSFNNLKSAALGDEFVLYATSGVYFYKVTNLLADWRESVAGKYIHNFDIDKSKCYIITCGRDNFLLNGQSTRYKDFLVEGTLYQFMTWKEYKQKYK